MSTTWPVQEAQSRFGEVIERALREGPQTVTQRGKPVVRVVAVAGADATPTSTGSQAGDFLKFLLRMPKVEGGLPDMPRQRSAGRPPLFADDE
ncbi:prevent-host-death protein [Vandammella animalimorsus]|uniref:Antitoxin n=1 Tax=Vandammella animalimorsus TaxID=2029117 RepID=A0A2A2AQN4_9BURK|nr:type II toxin-antitoxin system prevent-host-death family antitoxin [Vandammella animalimorsus]PAT37990.1 prevent-host-death protein [Vandammella animalimorsus]PAT40032.1 prevent-host-death protein [Vandammella animalimorsus]